MRHSRKLRVFICYASQDRHIVLRLCRRLSAEGWIDPWLDVEKLLPGQEWASVIEKELAEADIVIVCLSSNAMNKEGWLQREIRHAVSDAEFKPDGIIFIIPILLDECSVPRHLLQWQHLKYYPNRHRRDAYKRLILSLIERAEGLNILKKRNLSIKVGRSVDE